MRQTPKYEVRRLRAIRLLDDDRCLGQPRGGCLGDNRCKEAGFDEPPEERGPDVLELLGEELVGDVTSLPLECEVGDVEIFDPHAAVVAEQRAEMLADQRLVDGNDARHAAEHLQEPGTPAPG